VFNGVVLINLQKTAGRSSITAGQESQTMGAFELVQNHVRERSFTGTADGQIPHHDGFDCPF